MSTLGLNYLMVTKTTANVWLFTYVVFSYVTTTLNTWTRDDVVVVPLIRDGKQIPLSGSVAKMFDIYWAMVWCGWVGGGGVVIYVLSAVTERSVTSRYILPVHFAETHPG